MTKVAVALSGGIDSAVTTKLLLEQGYEVVGITGKMACTSDFDEIILNAKKVAEKLGIEHYVLDTSKIFENKIINYFKNSYKNGLTPNPCIMCNKHIKWGVLLDYSLNELNCDYIATGHYANIKNVNGIYKLYPANDEHKDQLYFLFMLEQEHLKRTLFPLSKYKKDEVRKFADRYDLPPKSAKESQDICFIKAPMTTKKYLNNVFGTKTGSFIEKSTGRVLGKHDGCWQYTIGQRKGIGLAAPEALYVVDIDATSNAVYVGYKKDLIEKKLELSNVFWSYPPKNTSFEALIKIRYNMKPVRAKINISNTIEINFLEEVSGITKGQACVMYDLIDGHLLGGGFI